MVAVQIFFEGGARRNYLVINRPAANRRPGWAKSFSLADVVHPGDLDLRKPEHVAELETALRAMDVNALGSG
jgi:hypothetical protein